MALKVTKRKSGKLKKVRLDVNTKCLINFPMQSSQNIILFRSLGIKAYFVQSRANFIVPIIIIVLGNL